jgi:hypothetical protein
VISFTTWPEGKDTLGVQVLIQDSKELMFEHLKAWESPELNPDIEAVCLGIEGAKDVCAVIFFHKDALQPEVIAHECWHATLRWLRSEGLTSLPIINESVTLGRDSDEERGAYYHGALVQTIHDALLR